jgi:hypothetical protein
VARARSLRLTIDENRYVSSLPGRPFTRRGMSDPISRLQLARQEIDRVFGPGYAVGHPEVVCAVMQSASSDYAAQLVARAIEHVAVALPSRRRRAASCSRASC